MDALASKRDRILYGLTKKIHRHTPSKSHLPMETARQNDTKWVKLRQYEMLFENKMSSEQSNKFSNACLDDWLSFMPQAEPESSTPSKTNVCRRIELKMDVGG
ncbi:hypothetical protein AAMO2058_001391900 [Amorphochlora amoebiformis]|eukprot:1375043-Amorphochlora_amoeboformis.AAC.2